MKEWVVKYIALVKKIDFNNLTYRFKGPNLAPIYFIDFRGPMHIYI